MDIELTGLLVFRHIAGSGSFSETGRHWKISQPAVSLSISRLESAVGLVLLERSPYGTRLTAAGSRFLEHVNEVCDAYLALTDGMNALGRRIDREALVGVDRSWFGSRLRDALAVPGANVALSARLCEVCDNWSEGLKSTQYDVIVAGRFLRAGLSPAIQEAVIYRERGITVAWNPNFYPFDVSNFSFLEMLSTTILIPDHAGFASFLLMWCEHVYGMKPTHVLRFPCDVEAAAAAAAGLGVLLSPGDAIPRVGSAAQGLVHVRTSEFLLPEAFTFGVYCRSGESSKQILSTAAAIGRLGRSLFAPCVNTAGLSLAGLTGKAIV